MCRSDAVSLDKVIDFHGRSFVTLSQDYLQLVIGEIVGKIKAFSKATNIFILTPFVVNLTTFMEACLVTLGMPFLEATLTVSGYLITEVISDNNAGDKVDSNRRSHYNASFD